MFERVAVEGGGGSVKSYLITVVLKNKHRLVYLKNQKLF